MRQMDCVSPRVQPTADGSDVGHAASELPEIGCRSGEVEGNVIHAAEPMDRHDTLRAEAAAIETAPRVVREEIGMRKGRFLTNLIANLLGFGASILIGVLYTPYLVHQLGPGRYGMIRLILQIVGYFAVFGAVLNSAVGRFMIVSIEQQDVRIANRYFNTSLWGSGVLACLLLVPTALALVYVDTLIVVPAGEAEHVRMLFAGAAFAFLLSMIRTPFLVTAFCMNRFDVQKGLEVGERLAQIALVVLFFSLAEPQLGQVGMALAISAGVGLAASVCVWKCLMPTLHVSPGECRWSECRSLGSMGTWSVVNQLGALLFLAIDLILVNRLFGSDWTGRYAAILQWAVLLRTTAAVVANVFTPTIVGYYARGEHSELVAYIRRAIKCTGAFIILPIGAICGLSGPLLETWLGAEYRDLAPLMVLATIHLSVNLPVLPLFAVQTAANRVRTPALATLLAGCVNVALALVLAGPMKWGVYGIAAAGATTLTAKNLFFIPLYASRILHRPYVSLYAELLPVALACLVSAAVCGLIGVWLNPTGWPALIGSVLPLMAVYPFMAYWLLLDADDRQLLHKVFVTRIKSA